MKVEYQYFNFDTPITITLYYPNYLKKEYNNIEQEIGELLDGLELTFSRTLPSSEVAQLNKEKIVKQPSQELQEVLGYAKDICLESNKEYDPSSGPLIELWSITDENYIPTSKELEETLKTVDCEDIEISSDEISIKEEMIIDLGSIVKGYASDLLYNFLEEKGIHGSIINLGGNIMTQGSKPKDEPFVIGLKSPELEKANEVIATIELKEPKAVITSGINQRYFQEDGKLYHHIFNAKDGYPVYNELGSVTIISDSGIQSDALSTLVFIKGLEEGIEYVENLDNVEAIFITKEKEIYLTSGIKEINLLDDSYLIMNGEENEKN
jgi:thiamine biosynthesis lipoprotein